MAKQVPNADAPRRWDPASRAHASSGVWDLETGEWLPRWPIDVKELLKFPERFSLTPPAAPVSEPVSPALSEAAEDVPLRRGPGRRKVEV